MSDTNATSSDAVPSGDLVSPLVSALCARFTDISAYSGKADYPAIAIDASSLLTVMSELKSNPEFDFSILFSHTAVDRIASQQFELLYFLHSMNFPHRLLVSVTIPRQHPVVPTVSKIWKIAEWQEREVFDLLGIEYEGHPDLRRIFLEDDWQGFPLRKDYVDDFMLTRESEGEHA
jgi:NADH/F420H2 dehydrogenase subunit C